MSYWPKDENPSVKPYLFVHIPKTAGMSIQKWYRHTYSRFHRSLHGDLNHPVLRIVRLNMPSFTVVRNPYDLVYSWYRYKHQMLREVRHRDEREYTAWVRGFDYWLHRYIEKINLVVDKSRKGGYNQISVGKCQTDYIAVDNTIGVNRILRFENLSEEMNAFSREIGSSAELEFVNKTIITADDYRSAYTDSSKKLVEKYYNKDLDTFDYDF